jgi:hypothetical protein
MYAADTAPQVTTSSASILIE